MNDTHHIHRADSNIQGRRYQPIRKNQSKYPSQDAQGVLSSSLRSGRDRRQENAHRHGNSRARSWGQIDDGIGLSGSNINDDDIRVSGANFDNEITSADRKNSTISAHSLNSNGNLLDLAGPVHSKDLDDGVSKMKVRGSGHSGTSLSYEDLDMSSRRGSRDIAAEILNDLMMYNDSDRSLECKPQRRGSKVDEDFNSSFGNSQRKCRNNGGEDRRKSRRGAVGAKKLQDSNRNGRIRQGPPRDMSQPEKIRDRGNHIHRSSNSDASNTRAVPFGCTEDWMTESLKDHRRSEALEMSQRSAPASFSTSFIKGVRNDRKSQQGNQRNSGIGMTHTSFLGDHDHHHSAFSSFNRSQMKASYHSHQASAAKMDDSFLSNKDNSQGRVYGNKSIGSLDSFDKPMMKQQYQEDHGCNNDSSGQTSLEGISRSKRTTPKRPIDADYEINRDNHEEFRPTPIISRKGSTCGSVVSSVATEAVTEVAGNTSCTKFPNRNNLSNSLFTTTTTSSATTQLHENSTNNWSRAKVRRQFDDDKVESSLYTNATVVGGGGGMPSPLFAGYEHHHTNEEEGLEIPTYTPRARPGKPNSIGSSPEMVSEQGGLINTSSPYEGQDETYNRDDKDQSWIRSNNEGTANGKVENMSMQEILANEEIRYEEMSGRFRRKRKLLCCSHRRRDSQGNLPCTNKMTLCFETHFGEKRSTQRKISILVLSVSLVMCCLLAGIVIYFVIGLVMEDSEMNSDASKTDDIQMLGGSLSMIGNVTNSTNNNTFDAEGNNSTAGLGSPSLTKTTSSESNATNATAAVFSTESDDLIDATQSNWDPLQNLTCYVSSSESRGLSSTLIPNDGQYYVCSSYCQHCASASPYDPTCTQEQRMEGAKLSQNSFLPYAVLEMYETAYSNFGFTWCDTNDCNDSNACVGETMASHLSDSPNNSTDIFQFIMNTTNETSAVEEVQSSSSGYSNETTFFSSSNTSDSELCENDFKSTYTTALSSGGPSMPNSQYGFSVSMSGDGSIVAVGAKDAISEFNGEATGAVYLYSFDDFKPILNGTSSSSNSTNPLRLIQILYGQSPGDEFGNAVSLSHDGRRIVAGSRSRNGQTGAAWIFDRNGTTNNTLVSDISSKGWSLMDYGLIPGQNPSDRAGWALSISGDGNVVALSSPRGGVSRGGIVVTFTYNNETKIWDQYESVIRGRAGDEKGYSTALSFDGSRIIVGAPKAAQNLDGLADSGKVTIYHMNGSEWQSLGQEMYGEVGGNHFGSSVAISNDGNVVVIGGRGKNTVNATGEDALESVGHCKVYRLRSSRWELQYSKEGEAAGERLGSAVSISSNGNVVACGGVGGTNENYSFSRSGVTRLWNHISSQESTIWPQGGWDGSDEAAFGSSVSITSDAKFVLVGAPTFGGANETSGSIHMFKRECDKDWSK